MLILQENVQLLTVKFWSSDIFTMVMFFSTGVRTVRTVVVAKLVILDILFLTSLVLALRAAVVAQLVILGILF